MSEHRIEIQSTTDVDDGIYLRCACGWDFELGWHPSIEAAIEAAGEHRKQHGTGEAAK